MEAPQGPGGFKNCNPEKTEEKGSSDGRSCPFLGSIWANGGKRSRWVCRNLAGFQTRIGAFTQLLCWGAFAPSGCFPGLQTRDSGDQSQRSLRNRDSIVGSPDPFFSLGLNLFVPKTRHQMVVHHARRLHEGVANGGAAEGEAPLFHVFAHG
jgi:hypothetical protein